MDGTKPFSLDLIDSTTFAAANYQQHFLCDQILAAGQPCMIGGPPKCLKTTIALDLVISLGTGTPFLGHFAIPEAINVGIVSGESGPHTMQRNAHAIAKQRGLALQDSLCFWGDTLPQITKPAHLKALEEMIIEKGLKAVFIDPAYLCLMAGDSQRRNAANLFDMGSILLPLTELGQRTGCAIILIHHYRKNSTEAFKVPELSDLAFSGFAEWPRQWILLNRRERYEHESGMHRLWLTAGGSVGHDGAWSLDIDEGVLKDYCIGRKWSVSVTGIGQARQDALAAKEAGKRLAAEEKAQALTEPILKFLEKHPEGRTAKDIRE